MTPERWQQVEEVLQRALDRPAQERASFLDEACVGDDDLKNEATTLISAYDKAGDFIEQPAIVEHARVLVGGDPENHIGREVGPYRIIERLGEGGMGEVYLAEDSRLGRLVALKILPAYFASDDERLRRFHREARAASALNHPNILTIHEVGQTGEICFIATEFINGLTIRELIAKADLSVEEIIDIAEQVAFALLAAHAAGIVHRDIKPENIMRRTDGLVKILDFGIAKLIEPETTAFTDETQAGRAQTEAGVVMGTVDYMSPEQARALAVDERTDVWSLGVLLYEMLTRRKPFAGATRMDTMVGILEREPARLFQFGEAARDLEPLQRIIDKALRKERSERYQTANGLLSDLKSARAELDGGSKSTKPANQKTDQRTARETSEQTVQNSPEASRPSHVWPLLGIAVLLIVAIAGTFFYRRSITKTQAYPSSASDIAITHKTYAQMSEAEQLAFINDQEQRISNMMGDRPAKLNEEALRAIKGQVDRFVSSSAVKTDGESLRDTYARATPYVPLIARSFAARKVPIIIGIYLPMIESAYRPCFENSFGSKGLFQFLPQTARLYGVANEDMCDVEKMTPAAAHYIADRMAELGDDSESMTLVLLSYNRGPEWVRNTLRKLRDTENYERNFWTLFAHRDKLDDTFQNENAAYVPAFFAAAIIGENPATFELAMPPLSSLAVSGEQ